MVNLKPKTKISLLFFFTLLLTFSFSKPANAEEISNQKIFQAAANSGCYVKKGTGPHNTNKDNWRGKIVCKQSSAPAGYERIQQWQVDAAILMGGRKDVIAAFGELGVLNLTLSQN